MQGFPDDFKFLGNRMDVRTQIGNAVPPPRARAAGHAIIRAFDGERVSQSGTRAVCELGAPAQLALI